MKLPFAIWCAACATAAVVPVDPNEDMLSGNSHLSKADSLSLRGASAPAAAAANAGQSLQGEEEQHLRRLASNPKVPCSNRDDCDEVNFFYCYNDDGDKYCKRSSCGTELQNKFGCEPNYRSGCRRNLWCHDGNPEGNGGHYGDFCREDSHCNDIVWYHDDSLWCNDRNQCVGGGGLDDDCRDDDDCLGYHWCDNSNHQCKGGGDLGDHCRDDDDCDQTDYLWCESNDQCNGGGEPGNACRTDDDCDGHYNWCNQDLCYVGGEHGAACEHDYHCEGTYRWCNQDVCYDGGEEGKICEHDDHCEGDQFNWCYQGQCYHGGEHGHACEHDGHCDGTYSWCKQNVCYDLGGAVDADCTSDDHCALDRCHSGKCKLKDIGASCSNSDECESLGCDVGNYGTNKCVPTSHIKLNTDGITNPEYDTLNKCLRSSGTLGSWYWDVVTCDGNNKDHLYYLKNGMFLIDANNNVLNWDWNLNKVKLWDNLFTTQEKWYYIDDTKELRNWHSDTHKKTLDYSSKKHLYFNENRHGGHQQKFYFKDHFWKDQPRGPIKIKGNNKCWDVIVSSNPYFPQDHVYGFDCHYGHNQIFYFDKDNQYIKSHVNNRCLKHDTGDNHRVKARGCSNENRFKWYDWSGDHLKDEHKKWCAKHDDSDGTGTNYRIKMVGCNADNTMQQHTWPKDWDI